MLPKPIQSAVEHDYTKPYASSVSVRPSTSHRAQPGYTTLATKGSDDHQITLEQSSTCTSTAIGHSVHLLSSGYQQLGTAITMTGDSLHGHSIPDGYSKVAIQKIDPNVKPWSSLKDFNDEDLVAGSITAWPIKFMRKV